MRNPFDRKSNELEWREYANGHKLALCDLAAGKSFGARMQWPYAKRLGYVDGWSSGNG